MSGVASGAEPRSASVAGSESAGLPQRAMPSLADFMGGGRGSAAGSCGGQSRRGSGRARAPGSLRRPLNTGRSSSRSARALPTGHSAREESRTPPARRPTRSASPALTPSRLHGGRVPLHRDARLASAAAAAALRSRAASPQTGALALDRSRQSAGSERAPSPASSAAARPPSSTGLLDPLRWRRGAAVGRSLRRVAVVVSASARLAIRAHARP